MCGCAVEVEVVFLHILAMIAFVARQSEQTLLEHRITLIPQRQREANELVTIRDARQSILVPAVSSGTGVIVREILPGVSVRAVIFADGAPCAFAEVRSPPLPMLLARRRFRQSGFFLRHADSPALSILSRHANPSENL